MTDYSKLQNGSDVRGIALEGIPGETVSLTERIVADICLGFAIFLSHRSGKKIHELTISIGMDSRLSGPILKKAAIQALINSGVAIADFGLASTPAMFMSTILPGYRYDGAIMLTASHLPWNRNGLKFFSSHGGLEKSEVSEVLKFAVHTEDYIKEKPGSVRNVAFMDVYSDYLVHKICKDTGMEAPLAGLRIIVDAGNGAGGFFATRVLMPLGADISGSQFLEPDGRFPNHIPNPESQEAMDSIIFAVKKLDADLGIIFDTDVDRAAVVDNGGLQINRNRLVALMSAIVLEEHPYSYIVTDSITSDGLNQFIEKKLGGKHHRFKRGYKNVINESIRLNKEGKESWLAIETSGHAAMKENHFLDDGAYLIAKVLIKLATLRKEGADTLSILLKELKEPCEDKEIRFGINELDFAGYGKYVLAALPSFVNSIHGWSVVPYNYEGIRVSCDEGNGDGWFLLRMSLHDPVMPLNLESNTCGGIALMLDRLNPFFSSFEKLVMK